MYASPTLSASLFNTTQGIHEKPMKLLRVMAEDYEELSSLQAGEIAGNLNFCILNFFCA